MNSSVKEAFIDTMKRYPQLKVCAEDMLYAFKMIKDSYDNDGKLLIAGNGGSAADSEHIAGELMKRFKSKRPIDEDLKNKLTEIDKEIGEQLSDSLEKPLYAVPLTSHVALTTAYMNDVNAEGVFAQQLLGYGKKGDVFLAISTSGNSKNIYYACVVAKALGIKIVGLTGSKDSKLSGIADVCIKVPETETYKIQELHLPVYHCLCLMLENNYFGEDK
ncbi:MAG: SIS domain-containing protein [Erysipelotrichaceae bacterium]|nr:SIS domain-containing protein [Erysipelotrichaceae bacterium]